MGCTPPRLRRPGPLERKVLAFFRSLDLCRGGPAVLLVGVSGGPDSVCLLHVLSRLRERLGLSLHAAHLDHGLRGVESDGDREYVVALCGRLNVPVTAEKADLLAARSRHSPLEEVAREARYAFFARVAGETGAAAVAVGHTADDHLETVLLHLVRGAGTRGLTGLEQVSAWHGRGSRVRVVRPLLEARRSETEDYCRRFGLEPRCDASNLSLVPLRNRIRHELLPLLRRYNPGFDGVLARTARIAQADSESLQLWAAEVWPHLAQAGGGALRLDREKLRACPPGLRRTLLRRALEQYLGDRRDIEADHVEALMAALEKPAGKKLLLLKGLVARTGYRDIVLGAVKPPPVPPLDRERALNVPGETRLPGWLVTAEVVERKEASSLASDDAATAFFDFDVLGPLLSVRGRRRGDRLVPLGMSSPKKLQDIMVDARIPREWRDSVPLVCTPRHLAWVVGWRIDDRVKVTAKTRKVLRLRFDLTVAEKAWYINEASHPVASTG